MENKNQKLKVFVGMSGGVDSGVAAALLKKQGYNVTGVFMRLHEFGDEKNARLAAKKLDIPFKVFDFRREFKEKVINYFLRGYKRGITPNPCIVCNRDIKFGLLLERALKEGADYIATGHYVKKSKIKKQKSKIIYKLLGAKDRNKDQSYFLWTLTQDKLKKILFPLGNYTKKEVRRFAQEFKISDLIKKESEDICFIPNANLSEFLKSRIKTNKGKIMTVEGKVLGKHRGLAFYTIGQRKRIGLPGGPFYVVDKDLKKNLLLVSKKRKDLEKKELIVKNVNLISGKQPDFPLKAAVKIRYRHKAVPAKLSWAYADKSADFGKLIKVKFENFQKAVTPGQSAVFYKNKEVMGGGIIIKAKTCYN
ncbi:MAG: tRNA 2-thiouridine(34) synthase MnmA [Parcubacteria group bacterium CG11_big_fil_rev_8_21_14_0_20_39_14]|nr:MAG: tRNA 2-thiouridine(34) synthase MnmA [Parcubacteria group bacterium CG11_big_fil_rev_8_21_14_0_20_39_14]PIS35552.1 MAG: tRNA 2-thiouridine(34) synthase MnmA [Parcubacteria group bacterium CG08_land_8_20_14_0_20_38_56]